MFLHGIAGDKPFLYGDAYNYDGSAIGIIEMFKNAWPNLNFIIGEALRGTLGKGGNILHHLGIHFSVMVFNQGPVYPFFVALIYAIFGHEIHIVQYGQVFLDAISCILLFFVARKAFDDERAGMLAAIIWAFYLPAIYFTELLVTETLGTLVLLIALFSILRLDKNSAFKDFLACGIAIAILMLTRHPFRFVWAFIPIGLCFLLKGSSWKELVKRMAAFLCGVGILMMPWMALTAFATGKPSALPSNKDYWQELYVKNDVKYGGWPPDSAVFAARAGSPYKELFIRKLSENPIGIGSLWLEKVYRVWDRFANVRGRTFLIPDRLYMLVHRLLVCLGLFGLYLAWRRNAGKAALLLVIVGYTTLISSALHVESRYNFPAMPVIVMCAAYFLVSYRYIKRKLLAGFIIIAAFIAFMLPGVNWQEHQLSLRTGDVAEKIINLPANFDRADVKEANLLIDMVKPKKADLKIILDNDEYLYSEMKKSDRFDPVVYDDVFKLKSLDAEEVRKYHILPISARYLDNGRLDVKISLAQGYAGNVYPVVFGGIRRQGGKLYEGPSFARSGDETSLIKFSYDGDYRMPWKETLNNEGTENYLYTGIAGAKKTAGEYRIMLEVIGKDGTVKTY